MITVSLIKPPIALPGQTVYLSSEVGITAHQVERVDCRALTSTRYYLSSTNGFGYREDEITPDWDIAHARYEGMHEEMLNRYGAKSVAELRARAAKP